MADVGALPEVFSVQPEDDLALVRAGGAKRIKGKYLNSGSGGGLSLPASGGICFDGFSNTVPIIHQLVGAGISGRPLTFTFIVDVPKKNLVPASGRGIGGLSALNPTTPTTGLYGSIIIGIRGTGGGFGNGGVSKAGDLIIRATNPTGGDQDMVVADFCDTYGGKTVRLDFVRGLSPLDFPVMILVNGVQVIPGFSGSSTNFGVPFGTDPFFFYGYVPIPSTGLTRPWLGKIRTAGVATLDYTADAVLAMSAPTPDQLGGAVWGTVVGNRDSDMASHIGFTWNHWTGDGVAYTSASGGTVTPTAGDADSWAHGEVNGTAAPNKLRLRAKATAGRNRAAKSGLVRGYAYKVTVKARCVPGTGTPGKIYLGTGWNVGLSSQEENAGEALVFTPTDTEVVYTGRIVARSGGTLYLATVNNSESAGQIYEFDDVLVERDGWAVWTDMDVGDGFAVPNISNPAWDGLIPGGAGIAWATPKRNVPLCVRLSADQVVSSATAVSPATGATLVDTGLSFRVPANAKYSYEFIVPFALAGTVSGFKFNVTGPSGSPTGISTVTVANASANNLNEVQVTENYPVLVSGSLTSAATHLLRINGVIENGATEGPVTLQMAQLVSDASAITIKKNATVEFTRRV